MQPATLSASSAQVFEACPAPSLLENGATKGTTKEPSGSTPSETIQSYNVVEVAWAAGLFEGEGFVGFSSRSPRAGLVMTDEDVVAKFARIVNIGRYYLEPKMREGARKPVWRWAAYGYDQVNMLLGLLGPFLGQRRLQQFVDALSQGRPR